MAPLAVNTHYPVYCHNLSTVASYTTLNYRCWLWCWHYSLVLREPFSSMCHKKKNMIISLKICHMLYLFTCIMRCWEIVSKYKLGISRIYVKQYTQPWLQSTRDFYRAGIFTRQSLMGEHINTRIQCNHLVGTGWLSIFFFIRKGDKEEQCLTKRRGCVCLCL